VKGFWWSRDRWFPERWLVMMGYDAPWVLKLVYPFYICLYMFIYVYICLYILIYFNIIYLYKWHSAWISLSHWEKCCTGPKYGNPLTKGPVHGYKWDWLMNCALNSKNIIDAFEHLRTVFVTQDQPQTCSDLQGLALCTNAEECQYPLHLSGIVFFGDLVGHPSNPN